MSAEAMSTARAAEQPARVPCTGAADCRCSGHQLLAEVRERNRRRRSALVARAAREATAAVKLAHSLYGVPGDDVDPGTRRCEDCGRRCDALGAPYLCRSCR